MTAATATPEDDEQAAPAAEEADVVLLLVHGIGQQRAGSVVGDVANALLEWFRARAAGTDAVAVESAVLKPDVRGVGGPATVTLTLTFGATGPTRRLTLVESLWAEEFDPPGFVGVLRWVLGAGTWLVFQHLVTVPHRLLASWSGATTPPSETMRLIALMLGIPVLYAVAVPMQLAGLLLALAWLLPFEAIRQLATALLLGMGELIGDSYLFARNPVVRRALGDRVRQDFDALPAGRRVAVLAHSQGAAVALEMLERHPAPAPLVTYGAGIRKLHELADDAGDLAVPLTFRVLWLMAIVAVVAVGVLAINLRNVLAGHYESDPVAGLAALVLVILWVAGGVVGSYALDRQAAVDSKLAPRIRRLAGRQPHWLDASASHDLVPAGRLVAGAAYVPAGTELLRSADTGTVDHLAVVNDRSFITDHVTYWRNPGGFIEPVVAWLAEALDQPWLVQDTRPRPLGQDDTVRDAAQAMVRVKRRRRRAWRVQAASIVRAMVVAAAMILGLQTSAWWLTFLPGPDAVTAALAEKVPDSLHPALRANAGVIVTVGAAAAFLLGIALHGLLAAVFDALGPGAVRRATERTMGLRPPTTAGGWSAALAGAAAYVGIYALAADALVAAIRASAYQPLIERPFAFVLWLHALIFR